MNCDASARVRLSPDTGPARGGRYDVGCAGAGGSGAAAAGAAAD